MKADLAFGFVLKTLFKTAPRVHPGFKPKSVFRQATYLVRGLLFARETEQWFNTLQKPELAMVAGKYPYLFQKLQRPYINRIWNIHQRLQALMEHYNFVA